MLQNLLIIASLGTGFLVILATNPIHSVLALASTVTLVTTILISEPILAVEFLPILFIIVYVGAIAIIFLFVIMMLDIKYIELKDNATRYIPIGLIIGCIFLLEIYYIVSSNIGAPDVSLLFYQDWSALFATTSNIVQLGQYLYTDGFILFLVSSLVLLVAMVAAIVLTLHHEGLELVKRQDIFDQLQRSQDIPKF